jgi:hypothetical protein
MKTLPVELSDLVCASVTESLAVLQSLQTGVGRTDAKLLRAHNQPSLEWYMFVPEVFNNAIGILRMQRKDKKSGRKHVVWGQSGTFSFATGDVLFSQPEGHSDPGSGDRCFQVTNAMPSTAGNGGFRGSVVFDVFERHPEHKRFVKVGSHSVTQVEFVRILIAGFTTEL